jgi:hypothetical protein
VLNSCAVVAIYCEETIYKTFNTIKTLISYVVFLLVCLVLKKHNFNFPPHSWLIWNLEILPLLFFHMIHDYTTMVQLLVFHYKKTLGVPYTK